VRKEILLSGFGGQGLMSLGRILAKAAIREGKFTTWFPSYGAEMRGGTAHCFVKISDSAIASPFIDYPDIAVILNQPSLDKFRKQLKKGSRLILNSDLISNEFSSRSIKSISLPLNKIALDCGNIKTANIAALGVFILFAPGFIWRETVIEVLRETFMCKDILAQNMKAFCKGEEYVNAHKEEEKCYE